MWGVARALVLAAAGLATAGCITDGMVGNEADAAAKPRVIDTPKTRTVSSKKDAEKAARATEQGDTAARMTVARVDATPSPQSAPLVAAPSIPAASLFGNWTLVESGGQKCRVILGGVLIGTSYSARGEADCPRAFASVQSWEIQGDELVLRNQARAVVVRLQPTGPFRFDGQGDGLSVYLIR